MKVFKFYTPDYLFAYSGENEEEAKQAMFEDQGEMNIIKVEEIPESQWDEKTINIWEDNDFDTEPELLSINDQMFGVDPQLIFTNDMSTF